MKRIALTQEQYQAYKFLQRINTPMIVFTMLVKGILSEHGLIGREDFTFQLKDTILILDNVMTMGEYVSTY